MRIKTLALIFTLSSLSWACPKGSSEWRDGVCVTDIEPEGVSADESKKWRSDEKAPGKGHQPDWETGSVVTKKMDPVNPADEHHPKDCPNKCKWDGGTCSGDLPECNDTGKKP